MDNQTEMNGREILKALQEIKDLLVPISACYEEEYIKIQKRKAGEKLEVLEKLLTTPVRRQIFSLLFDPDGVSQVGIAKNVNTTQPTVSRFISTLLEQDFIEPVGTGGGNTVYKDKHDLLKLIQSGFVA